MGLKKLTLGLLAFGMGFSTAKANDSCLYTKDLRQINPDMESSPILFWKSAEMTELRLSMVRLPNTGEILINILECKSARLRRIEAGDILSGQTGAINSSDQPRYQCHPVGDLWLPVADRVDGEWNPDNPTDAYVLAIRDHLRTYASSLKWDPHLQTLIDSTHHLMVGAVGLGLYRLSTRYYPSDSRWRRVRRSGWRVLGALYMFGAAYNIWQDADSKFTDEMNKRAEDLEDLVAKINARMALRLDGQDNSALLDEKDGYSILVNAIKKANQDMTERFCRTKKEKQP
jgi:hypothetical protein